METKIKILLAFVFGVGTGFFMGWKTVSNETHKGDPVIARFNGGEIRASEIMPLVRSEVAAEREALSSAMKRVTLEKVKRHLLEIEAKEKGKSADQILVEHRAQHQETPVTPEEFNKYVSNQGLNVKKLSAADREKFTKIIQSQKVMSAQNDLIDSLLAKAGVEFMFPKND